MIYLGKMMKKANGETLVILEEALELLVDQVESQEHAQGKKH